VFRIEIAVSDAAGRLGLSQPRVRQLLASGDLAGRRLGRSWLVSDESVARLQQNRRLSGRPLGPRRAWGLLDILAGGEAAWLTSSARSQLKTSMRRLAGADADEWRAALRGRSQVLACQAHPAAIPRLLSHQRVLPAGLAMLRGRDFDLTTGPHDIDQLYADPVLWPDIAHALAIRAAGPDGPGIVPNLTVLLPRIAWPFGDRTAIPDSVLAADLLESPEPRAVSAGAQRLSQLLNKSLA
jgi:excisionase family DNA binding protein